MRQVAVVAVLVLLVCSVAASAQEKWVRGDVTAVSGTSITVKTAEGPMTFAVDKSTDVIVRGGATATYEARKAGQEGTTLTKLFKVSDKVMVHYRETAGVMTATEIRGGVSGEPTAPAGQAEAQKGSSVSGIVTALSDRSITIKARSGQMMTFTIDAKSKVLGRGVGTAAQKAKEEGKPTPATLFLKVNDDVRVNFTGQHADEVYLRIAATK